MADMDFPLVHVKPAYSKTELTPFLDESSPLNGALAAAGGAQGARTNGGCVARSGPLGL